MRNSSYNLIPILLKLCRHCDHALKIGMWLGCTPQINFCHFFLARLHEVHRAIVVTSVVRVYVDVRITLSVKVFKIVIS